jgi:hypothetical protein
LPENDADSHERPAEEAELARLRGRPLLVALADRLPTAVARANVTAQLATAAGAGLDLPRDVAGLIRACNWILHAREHRDSSRPGRATAQEIPLGSHIVAVTPGYVDAPLLAEGVSEETAQAVRVSRLRSEAGASLDPELAAVLAEPEVPRCGAPGLSA